MRTSAVFTYFCGALYSALFFFMGFEVGFIMFILKNMWALSFYRSLGFYRGILLSIEQQNLRISSEGHFRWQGYLPKVTKSS